MSQTKNMKEKQSLQDSHPGLPLEADGWNPAASLSYQISPCCGNAKLDINGLSGFEIELVVKVVALFVWVRDC
jgi:hypothetical protein